MLDCLQKWLKWFVNPAVIHEFVYYMHSCHSEYCHFLSVLPSSFSKIIWFVKNYHIQLLLEFAVFYLLDILEIFSLTYEISQSLTCPILMPLFVFFSSSYRGSLGTINTNHLFVTCLAKIFSPCISLYHKASSTSAWLCLPDFQVTLVSFPGCSSNNQALAPTKPSTQKTLL